MNPVLNRSEILFIYDVKWANPNGDPLDENRPRFDEETSKLFVTDVRLKRTVRDYLAERYNETLWVTGEAVVPEERMRELDITDVADACQKCIDIRLFGAVIPQAKKGAMETSITGPIQFRYGMSLHRVKLMTVQGTAAFATKDSKQRSFREDQLVPYALVAFYGVINQNSARFTGLTEDDVSKFLEGVWLGTKNLITRSKMEHNPRLLVRVIYKEGVNYHSGELDYLVKVVSEKEDEEIRDVSELKLDITDLRRRLDSLKDKIEKIEYSVDDRLRLLENGIERSFKEIFGGFQLEKLEW
ncbi:type I-B CRISPR-associated protein Cas7/Csh2 [Thermotoga sp. SG1]|uniref:type I-B CRISPR-associated protein Cas7/Csh2 n=1 Tax=Thermotoga sp. SG1 TaxID=126739 RepID=UPI000C77E4A7|nr:type I-B CRISPR-associated protein Cas7/Csh2 [Thermotoga sp. SG1]PLV57154.1 type I-B CRISPR-associated protein Cas7/Csh2 [Thermotoga sp. SG1]